MCGKPGKWPLCEDCEKNAPKTEEKKVKKQRLPGISKEARSLNMRREDYYECILQMRCKNPDVDEFLVDALESESKKRKFIVWRKGNDYYFSDIKAGKNVAKLLVKQFKLNLNETRKQVGFDRNKSKTQFKWTICLR